MSRHVALAVTGSNLAGDVPFAVALALPDGAVVGARPNPGARGDLARLCAELCAAHAVAPSDLGEVRVDTGPGSYTGLRVAVTFVRCLLQFGGVRVQALDSLALLAARARATPGDVRVVLDARRDRVHVQSFVVSPASVVATAPPAAVPFATVLAGLQPGARVVVPANLPAAMVAGVRTTGALVQVEAAVLATELFAPGLPFAAAAIRDLEPRYLMGSYAEE
jgi:tRNA threonylcarbamoyladenosine biosynthesis protein TsaB